MDFYCAERRLAIELDGPVHDHQEDQDRQRDKALSQEGIRVVRIRNEEATPEFLARILAEEANRS